MRDQMTLQLLGTGERLHITNITAEFHVLLFEMGDHVRFAVELLLTVCTGRTEELPAFVDTMLVPDVGVELVDGIKAYITLRTGQLDTGTGRRR